MTDVCSSVEWSRHTAKPQPERRPPKLVRQSLHSEALLPRTEYQLGVIRVGPNSVVPLDEEQRDAGVNVHGTSKYTSLVSNFLIWSSGILDDTLQCNSENGVRHSRIVVDDGTTGAITRTGTNMTNHQPTRPARPDDTSASAAAPR